MLIASERHVDISDNFAFAEIEEATIERMIREVANEGCDSAVILCTNMRGAVLAARLEAETSLTVYDSVAVTLWKCLESTGSDPAQIRGWGRLFTAAG
jgi:maleate isomerase